MQMHSRNASFAGRGHSRFNPSNAGSISGQKAFLANAYQELGKELFSTQIKVVGNYSLGRIIGEGSFGSVRLALHRLTATRCAIKQIPRSATPPLLTREIHHHRRLHHPHVVQLYEIIATETHIWLVFELCAGGELFDYLVEQGRLQESEARRVFGQLCLGVAHIHAQGIVHRDLKLENVLLNERCDVKIADFGFGREFEQGKMMETFCGTTGYASPEVLAGRKYTGEVDVWSLGVILYTLLTGSLPFDDDDEESMKRKIMDLDYEMPNWLPDDVKDLIARILVLEPSQRPSVKSILAHSWFARPILPFMEAMPAEVVPVIPEEEAVGHYREITTDSVDSYQSVSDKMSASQSTATLKAADPAWAQRDSPRATASEDATSFSRPSRSTPIIRSLSRSSSIASPSIPFVAHSRTPSRTKRRSVGSSYSERLLPAPMPPVVDYVSLLNEAAPEPFTTSSEQLLLESLSSLGFDIGQITHSIRTDACDCSGAIWWQLKRKAEEKAEALSDVASLPRSPAEAFMRRGKASNAELGSSPLIRRSDSPEHHSADEASLKRATKPKLRSRGSSLSAPSSPQIRTRHRSTSASESRPQRQKMPNSTSAPFLSSADVSPDVSQRSSWIGPVKAEDRMPEPIPNTTEKRQDKQRSTSISILQRATSAFGSSSAKETRPPSEVDSGRSTPLAHFFGRKPSTGLIEKASKERLQDLTPSPEKTSPPRDKRQEGSGGSPKVSQADNSPAMASESSLNTQDSSESHHSASPQHSITQTSPASSASGKETVHRQARSSLFSSFRMWFNEDRRKRKHPPVLAGFDGSSVSKYRIASTSSVGRTVHSIPVAQSPLRKPPIASRRSSDGTTHVNASRRSSATSLYRQPDSSAMDRRASIDSRISYHSMAESRRSTASNEAEPFEEAALVRSDSQRQFAGKHRRHGSQSSAASRASGRASPSQRTSFRRAPATTTQVRRVNRPHHQRRDSTSSSVISASSRRSSFSEDESHHVTPLMNNDPEPIPEEEENETHEAVEKERARALRKLSGDLSSANLEKLAGTKSTIFTAHKSTSVFSPPATTLPVKSASNHGRSSKTKPALRDIFKDAADEDEWIDEDTLSGFGSGFGQQSGSFPSRSGPKKRQDSIMPASMIGAGRYAALQESGSMSRPTGLAYKGSLAAPVEEEEPDE